MFMKLHLLEILSEVETKVTIFSLEIPVSDNKKLNLLHFFKGNLR